jgi:hypothetical protein
VSLPARHRSRPLAAAESESLVNGTLSAAQLALSTVPGVALVLTIKLLIASYRDAAARAAEPTWRKP